MLTSYCIDNYPLNHVAVVHDHEAGIIGDIVSTIQIVTDIEVIADGIYFSLFICLQLTPNSFLSSLPLIVLAMSEEKKKVSLIKRMFSSGTSAIITKTIVTPFDVVKTYVQVFVYDMHKE